MTVADAIARLRPPSQIAQLASKCPWCGLDLDGRVMTEWVNGNLVCLMQTKRIGGKHGHDYTWTHQEGNCCVPELRRIPPRPPSAR